MVGSINKKEIFNMTENMKCENEAMELTEKQLETVSGGRRTLESDRKNLFLFLFH